MHEMLLVCWQMLQVVYYHFLQGSWFRNREGLLKLYRVLIGLHWEYCAQFWSTYLRWDTLAWEVVLQKFTRQIPEITGLSYYKCLKNLEQYSLDVARMKDDHYDKYKILRVWLVRECQKNIRESPFKMMMYRKLQRLVNLQNSPSGRIVEAKLLSVFKEK